MLQVTETQRNLESPKRKSKVSSTVRAHVRPTLYVQGLSGKAHSFSPSAQHVNESRPVSRWEGTVQVQARCPSLKQVLLGSEEGGT